MLDKRSKNIVAIFGFVVLLIIITEVTRPTPMNWSASYTSTDKIPFGSYILFEELNTLFGDTPIEKVIDDPYVFLSEKNEESNAAYVFINDYINFDQRQFEELKRFANQGNTVLLSASTFGVIIEDSLKFYAATGYSGLKTMLKPAFFSSNFKKDTTITYTKGVGNTTFSTIDTINTNALGYYRTETAPLENLNFIEIQQGEGSFLIHTLPEAFSNYYMLMNNDSYAAHVLSYLETDYVYWDAHIKSGKRVISSPMRYIFSQKPLTWAYYLLALGLILFVIFRAKREQRIIKVVKPLENTSVEFTKTIGQMYFQHKDYGNIIAKKINYFMEVVRSKYYLDTNELSEGFAEKLALKSGNNINKTTKLIQIIKHQKSKAFHSEADLLTLNKLIEDFRL